MWWKLDENLLDLEVLKLRKKKRHSDSPDFNSITLKGNKSEDKILDFPIAEP